METESTRHYRHGSKIAHIGVECLPAGKDITVVMSSCKWMEQAPLSGKIQDFWEATFLPNPYFDKPMVLTSWKNRLRLAKHFGSPYIGNIKNLPVILTQEWDKAVGGGMDWALRISNKKATAPPRQETVEPPRQEPNDKAATPPVQANKRPSLTMESSNYSDIKEWLKLPGNKIESIIKKYDVEEAALNDLKTAI